MHLNAKMTHVLELSSKELVLICKALGGRLRTEDGEIEEAKLLGDELSKQRVHSGRELVKGLDKLAANLGMEGKE